MSWSSPTTKFNGQLIQEVHSQAYDGVCPQCDFGWNLIMVAGGIIVCRRCGVAFHEPCILCEEMYSGFPLCPDGACKCCWIEAGYSDWKDWEVPLWLRQKVLAGVIPNVIWGYTVWRVNQ